MRDPLPYLHTKTYDFLAVEYENRVETLRSVTEYALSHLIKRLEPGLKVLDIGCAVGYTIEILRQAEMIPEGIDISPEMIKYAKKRNPNSKLVVGDFITRRYPKEYYDAAFMMAFIHLFPLEQAKLCFHKAAQLLKPGGLLFVGTTKSDRPSEGYEEKADYPNQLKRFRKKWTPCELEGVLKDCGFGIVCQEDITDDYGKVWMDYIAQKLP